MGSFFAGVKAGTLAGVAYVGGIALFNVFLLYAFKSDVLALISQTYSQSCVPAQSVNATTVAIEDCFNSVLVVYIPLVAFLGFFVSLIYSGIFGALYETFPGRSVAKGETLAVIVGINFLLLSLVEVYSANFLAKVAITAFFVVWTAVYGLLMGRLYTRYTRVVEVASQDDKALRVLIDGRDQTGKTRTFALRSSHTARAKLGAGSSFREWSASGGVKVEDTRSFETTMEVEGDGVLRGQFKPES